MLKEGSEGGSYPESAWEKSHVMGKLVRGAGISGPAATVASGRLDSMALRSLGSSIIVR